MTDCFFVKETKIGKISIKQFMVLSALPFALIATNTVVGETPLMFTVG
jgi:hypothetical protein